MKPRTFAIQIVCVIFGVAFMFFGLVAHARVGGFLIGSLMFFAAALIGADPTTNPSSRSRRVFQTMAGMSALPFVIASVPALVELFEAGDWTALGATVLRLAVFILAAFVVMFSERPVVQRQLKKLGLFTPTS